MLYNLLHCCRNLESNLVIYDLFSCIRTFLNIFAETMSPIVFLIFWIISPKPCRRSIWYIFSTPRRRYIIFDDELGHGNHSGELLLFVGCIVNFVVSYLICMFQDSVPAGWYNDTFLSSVCVCAHIVPVRIQNCMCVFVATCVRNYVT
jgi:hypothetical protein